jgi:CRP-like cAMP-binding protein
MSHLRELQSQPVRNGLLSVMSDEDFSMLRPHFVRRPVSLHDVLIEPNKPIEHVYFPESGLVSFVSPTEIEIEVGVVRREGFVGASVTLGVDRLPLKAGGQIKGEGNTLSTVVLLEAVEASGTLRTLLSRYTHVFMMQMASTAYANAHFTIEQRLARWLLMCCDGANNHELELTHEFLALMLCVRRPGVTVATHILEGQGIIRAKRGRITILDRPKLADLAGDCYGLVEAEYERVIMPKIRKEELRTIV